METRNPPKFMERDKLFKGKDIIVALKYFGASFDKLKTNTPNRARALVLGYKAWKLGLNEAQLRSVLPREISDKEILEVLEYKEKKSIRSWSIFTKVKEDDYKIKVERMWCKKLGAICLIAKLGQKELIALAKERFENDLDCTIPKEF
ncbi:hypothetical protein [Sulfurospirillum barnesii]|uniref:Uncharacterized protein n=1 Tax=Sulfurospirillum barnesii (strain ATCC 700032 / DSM 10660 / SES-3) TaxID=760154 RepID=I3XX43_SULBS|nr:hypothetical protein [Sulfurospirillum barnesii]AFL68517.1 hypothetical protein Sulba_1223 [Sulfurospirillum barnesii SES-3]